MKVSIGLLATLLFSVSLPPDLIGQDSSRVAVTRALRVGDSVRLDASGLGRVEGRLLIAEAGSLTLASRAGSLQVSVADLERLWVRSRATKQGALLGAVVGGVVGVVYGLLISSVACEPVDGGDCTAAGLAAIAGVIGGAGGAALGAGVGATIPIWRMRFP